jgi:hypothetical protein
MVGRPFGTPPFVTSSKPLIPVGDFSNGDKFRRATSSEVSEDRETGVFWLFASSRNLPDAPVQAGKLASRRQTSLFY